MRLLNAFSLNMVAEFPAVFEASEVGLAVAQELAKQAESAVGHADTAAVFGDVLGVDVPANRISVTLNKGDEALVGQYIGPRLAEGSTKLPEGATIKWIVVSVK